MQCLAALSTFGVCSIAFGQHEATLSGVSRARHHQTVHSDKYPTADFEFNQRYRYVGAQVVDLYGNAEAEQHAFAAISADGSVGSLFWVQFEHFFPTNTMTYNYDQKGTTEIGGIPFVYDIRGFSDLGRLLLEDSASDGAAMVKLFKAHGLAFPRKAALVRMFHLPSQDRRTELMIIYVEAVAETSKLPVAKEGISLDEVAPETAKSILRHMLEGISIKNYKKPVT